MRTETLLDDQLEHVLAALTTSNRLVCEVALHTGLRVGDVLSLKTAQLAPIFYVTERKTGKKKRVGLPAPLLKRLRKQAGKTWVFQHRVDPTRHRTRQAVWADVKRAGKAFRLPQNIGTHTMRKTYAQWLLRKYGDIEKVRKALNHDNLTVTMLYVMADRLIQQDFYRRRKRGANAAPLNSPGEVGSGGEVGGIYSSLPPW